MLFALLLLSALGAVHAQLRDDSDPIDAPGYYDLQFPGASSVGANVLRRAEAVLGYTPTDYVPPHSLRVWIDSVERGAALLDALRHVRSVRRVEREARRADIAADVRRLRVQHREARRARISESKERLGADAPDAEQPFRNRDSFAFGSRASSGNNDNSMLLQLRVRAHNMTAAEIGALAQPVCRTHVSTRSDHADERAHDMQAATRRGAPDQVLLSDVHCDDAARVADALATDPRVAFVELRAPFYSLNQWGSDTLRRGAGLVTPGSAANALLDALDGAGQVLSLSDTGVATQNCFFHDESGAAVPVTGVQAVPADTGHRKVRAYWSGVGGDFGDFGADGGHGTHVAGTALGAALSGASERVAEFGGASRGARLAVVDLLDEANDGGFLSVPLELDATLMRWSADVGAHVHSGSWGASLNGRYSSDEQALDLFAYENRHFLMVFAAGNSGPDAASIVSPAMAKNVLCVGSTMNGVESVELAQDPSRPASHYSPDWLSTFSSRGAASLPFRKPDLVAPGGPYVWSADAAQRNGRCDSLADEVVGLAGTSMATPLVAAGALLVREYFAHAHYTDSAQTGIDASEPTASLLRAALTASAQPMVGVYPNTPFSSVQQRIDSAGHGRVALDALIDSERVQLAVLANEDGTLGVFESREARWCVEVVDESGAPTEQYERVTAVLAYADYPSTPTSARNAVALVNDLRLVLADGESGEEFRVNEQDGNELRSTIERAQAAGTARLSLAVTADRLGFGDTQTYSLLLTLRRSPDALGTRLRISAPSVDGERCALCTANNSFDFERKCPVCGNGVIEAPLEQCDSSVCCDEVTCQRLDDRSPCTVPAGDCRLEGQCEAGLCAIDDSIEYVTDPTTGLCVPAPEPTPEPTTERPTPQPTPRPTPRVPGTTTTVAPPTTTTTTTTTPAPTAPPCTHFTADEWRAEVRLDRDAAGSLSVCCAPLWAALEQISFDRLFDELLREYAAARLNAALPGATATPSLLIDMERAHELLEETCGVGLYDVDARAESNALIGTLRRYNTRCVEEGAPDDLPPPAAQCERTDDDVVQLGERYCSGGGVFDRATNTCACHSNRHPNEPDCAHLACSGHGASLYNYTASREQCVCADGWSGPTCAQCAPTLDSALARHCIGLPTVLTTADNSLQRHVLAIVQTNSVVARLSGDYYARNVAKVADGRPGRGSLDCWCREQGETLDYRAFEQHADALRANALMRQLNDELAARAAPLLLQRANNNNGNNPRSSSAPSLDLSHALATTIALALAAHSA